MEEDEIDSASEYVCDMCPGVYKTKKNLRQHKAKIHSEEKFICSDCGFQCLIHLQFYSLWLLLNWNASQQVAAASFL